MEIIPEKDVHLAFRLSLFAKGAFAIAEIVGGVLAYFVSQDFLYYLASTVTQNELTEDPNDILGNFLLHLAQGFSIGAQHFTAYYLVSHGVVKLFLIAGLLKRVMWAYPAALIVFTLFIIYQLFRYSVTHSPWLIVISLLDLIVIALTWHEYRYMKKIGSAPVTDSQATRR
jgi:uncharacterized membrane protein